MEQDPVVESSSLEVFQKHGDAGLGLGLVILEVLPNLNDSMSDNQKRITPLNPIAFYVFSCGLVLVVATSLQCKKNSTGAVLSCEIQGS